MSCLRPLRLLLAVTVNQTLLVFDDFGSFKEDGQVFCRLSLSWELCAFFLVVCQGLWVFPRKTTEVPFSHHVTGTSHQRDVAL